MLSTKRRRLVIILLALLGLSSLAAATYLFAQAPYTLYDGDTAVTLNGRYATVGDLLDAAGVSLRPEDGVTPPRDAPAPPGGAIQIERARPVSVRTEEAARTLWTRQPTLGAFLLEAGIRVQRADQIFADGRALPFGALDTAPLPATLEIGRFHTITIQDGDQRQVVRTAAQTVGAALQETGVTVYAADGVTPPLGAWLTPNLTIEIKRSKPLTLVVDGRVIQTRSHHANALDVLAEAGVGLIGFDYTRPGPETLLKPDDVITVVRVTEDFVTVDQPIPFQTLHQANAELALDTQAVVSYGTPGIQRQRLRVRYENGVEVSRTVDGEWMAQAPVNQVIGYGTQINLGVVDTPQGPREYWRVVRMRVTSYTAASSGRAPNDPRYGITASGRPAGTGVVAADRAVVPFRSEVFVPGYGVGFVGDTGGGVRGRWIDLGYDEDEFVSWSGYVDVYYLTPVPPPDKINYLLPQALP